MDENKRKDGPSVVNQMAFIVNYQPHIEHQHFYSGGMADAEDTKKDDADAERRKDDADAEKRKRLMATNTVIRNQTQSGTSAVDLLKLYKFIDRYFVSEITSKYEWYALRRFLEKYRLLRDCDNKQFASQMNHEEWFAHSPKSCEANEMNYYSYLNGKHPERWLDTPLQQGTKATRKSVAKIYKTFANLELYKDGLLG